MSHVRFINLGEKYNFFNIGIYNNEYIHFKELCDFSSISHKQGLDSQEIAPYIIRKVTNLWPARYFIQVKDLAPVLRAMNINDKIIDDLKQQIEHETSSLVPSRKRKASPSQESYLEDHLANLKHQVVELAKQEQTLILASEIDPLKAELRKQLDPIVRQELRIELREEVRNELREKFRKEVELPPARAVLDDVLQHRLTAEEIRNLVAQVLNK